MADNPPTTYGCNDFAMLDSTRVINDETLTTFYGYNYTHMKEAYIRGADFSAAMVKEVNSMLFFAPKEYGECLARKT